MSGRAGVTLIVLGVAAGLGYLLHEGWTRRPAGDVAAHGRDPGGALDMPDTSDSAAPALPRKRRSDVDGPGAAGDGDGRGSRDAGSAAGGDSRGARDSGAVIGVRPAQRHASERALLADQRRGELPEPSRAGAARAAARDAAVPAPGAGRAGAAGDGEEASAEAADPDGGADILLSIPLRGDVEPAQGTGDPPETSGLVTNGGAVEFTEDAQYTLPAGGHVNSEAGTISLAIEPRWAGTDESNNSLLQIRDEHRWENSLGIVKNYNALRYVIRDELGIETNVNVYIDAWQPNERHVVTATWDEERMTLSVDGEAVGQAPLPNRVYFADTTPIHIGSDFPSSAYRGADARISDVTISATAPRAADVP